MSCSVDGLKQNLHSCFRPVRIVDSLITQHSPSNQVNPEGYTSLHCAATAGYIDVIRLLLR